MNELDFTMPQLLVFIAIMLPLVAILWADLLTVRPEEKQALCELLEALERGQEETEWNT